MKKEEIISSVIMCIVCGLVLVGFTIAWFTNSSYAVATGLQLVAGELGNVKVSLTSGGEAIENLEPDASIGLTEYVNVDAEKLAPGVCGAVTFYVTPKTDNISLCDIRPTVLITLDGSTWYPDVEAEESADSTATDALKKLSNIAQRHIRFYSDTEMTTEVTADSPYQLTWSEEDDQTKDKVEKKATLYWRWDYEYPFNGADDAKYLEANLSTALQKEKDKLIRDYDLEDMELGNNVLKMKFYFTFSAQ